LFSIRSPKHKRPDEAVHIGIPFLICPAFGNQPLAICMWQQLAFHLVSDPEILQYLLRIDAAETSGGRSCIGSK